MISATPDHAGPFCLQMGEPCKRTVTVATDPVEVAIPTELPRAGAQTSQLKVLKQKMSAHDAEFTFMAMAGAKYSLPVRVHKAGTRVEGAQVREDHLALQFPEGEGYQTVDVVFRW